MSLAPYRALLRVPAIRNLLLLGVFARVPMTAAGIVLVLYVQGAMGRSWLEAGLVGTATTLGAAIGSPWRGRLLDRFGLRRTIAPSILVEAVVWAALPWLPFEGVLVAALIGGLMGLPIFTVVRQSLSVVVPAAQRRSAYAIDSVGVELSFMTGPALGVLVATQLSTTVAIYGVGAAMVLSGLALVVANPATRSSQASAPATVADGELTDPTEVVPRGAPVAATAAERPRRMASPALLAVLGAAAGATVVLYGTDIGVVAVLREANAIGMSALVFAFWGIGSIVGGLVYGALPRGVHPLWLLLALGLLSAPIGLASSPWLLALAILPAGLLCAPVISSTAEAVARLVPETRRGEAMGWHGSAMTLGGALGGPAAGVAVDAVGPWGGFALVGLVGALLAAAALAAQQVRRRVLVPAVS
jgi:MFS family permease